jgi:predicted ATP-dependent serine protease
MTFPRFATGTLKGFPGSGKSTIATAAACCIARDEGVDVLYISAEEGGEPSAVQRFKRVADMLGIDVPPGLIISDAQDVHEADADVAAYEQKLAGRKGFIVIDSLTQLRPAQAWWEDILNSGHGVLLVLHTTTSGEARGGREPEFAVSFTVAVDGNGHAVITKSRWGVTGEEHAFNARQPPRIVPLPAQPSGAMPPSSTGTAAPHNGANARGHAGHLIPFPRQPQ